MTLAERLNEDLKTTLRTGDTRRRSVIRLVLAATKNAELVKNGPLTADEVAEALRASGLSLSREQAVQALEASWASRRGELLPAHVDERAVAVLAEAGERKARQAGSLTDAELESIIQKQAKQRRDSIEAYRKAGREDLAATEEAELTVLQEYLPQPLTASELRTLVSETIAAVGATNARDIGKVVPVALARAGARADGRSISAMARELLQ